MMKNNYRSNYIIILLLILSMCSCLFAQEETVSDSVFKTSINAYPYIFYSPETQLAFGAGGVMAFYTAKDTVLKPSNITLSGFYSTIKTYELFAKSNLFFIRNKFASTVDIAFSHKVDRFYGIGNDTPDRGNEEYVMDNYGGIIDLQMPPLLVISDRSGLVFEYRKYTMIDEKENPYLRSDTLIGTEGGVVSGMGIVWVWDTRDHVFFPNSGGFTQMKLLFYTRDLGSDFTFTWTELNIRRYWSFLPDQVIAVQIFLQSVGGVPPFFKLPALGGSRVMRGYFEGRYRDRDYFAMQVEYRQYFWWRFGYVVFAGFGDVARDITQLSLSNLKPSYGVGIRFLFNKEQKINLRVDLGLGKNTSGIYFSIEEAF